MKLIETVKSTTKINNGCILTPTLEALSVRLAKLAPNHNYCIELFFVRDTLGLG
jgi:hypothetical protein